MRWLLMARDVAMAGTASLLEPCRTLQNCFVAYRTHIHQGARTDVAAGGVLAGTPRNDRCRLLIRQRCRLTTGVAEEATATIDLG